MILNTNLLVIPHHLKNYLRCFKCSYEYGVFSMVINVAISVAISVTVHEF